MNNENIIAIHNLKKNITKWRILSIIVIFILIIVLIVKASVNKKKNKDVILKIEINSEIKNNLFSEEKLKYLEQDFVKGIVLVLNSPGGDVVESEKLYNIFRKIAIKKPMIVLINGVCSSGCYLVALASDYILAYNTSIVGSIGVLIQSFEITELAKKIGINLTNYKSSPLKNALNPFEKITPDIDMAISQQLDDVYDYFVSIFTERRKLKTLDGQEIANGQTYTGRQALELKLIDKINTNNNEINDFFETKNLDLKKNKIQEHNIYKKDKKHNFINKILSETLLNIEQNKHSIKFN